MGTHDKEVMTSTKRGSKRYLRKRHKKTSEAHNETTKAHYKHTTMKQSIVRK
jgi:hypothetical protein